MSPERFPSRRGDRGMTLPELLVTVTMMGLLATVLAAAITVVLRQSRTSEGRLNVASAEQSIDTWLPADLASTDVTNVDLPAVDLDPHADPCGNCGTIDLSGANALQLAWQTTAPGPTLVTTTVQYQYVQRDDDWVIERIECVGSNPCTVRTLLTGLEPPADPETFDPDSERPTWVMDVAIPVVDPDLELSANARQIIVTVDGGGSTEGAGGGVNRISLTAGGRTTTEIEADDFTVPSFVRAKSRCGGPITLIVDDSGSIGSGVTAVEAGVTAFIDAFRGTPTDLQIIRLEHRSKAIGSTEWNHYVDMTDESAVDVLQSAMLTELNPTSGTTNYEDAFYRTLKNSDGTTSSDLPQRIVFFTDGVPSTNRATIDGAWYSTYHSGDSHVNFNGGVYSRASGWPRETGAYHQESWDRADVILDQHRDIDMIFVGVGSGLDWNVSWIHEPTAYENPNAAPASAQTKKGWETLTYLLANGPSGHVTADFDGLEVTNAETANWYRLSDFDPAVFAAAMKATALKDCGGTLTLQTRLTDGTPVSDEFVYENPEYRDQDGTVVSSESRHVTTSAVFRTGTFDFEFAGASSFSIDVTPQELQTLSEYTPVGWDCRSGGQSKTTVPIDIDGSSYTGFTIDLTANEAASCILTVSK